jgi:Tfp pilus assembly protein PilN
MRPVNLIPPEDRRGDRAPLRAGSLSYIVIGAFGAALVAVLMLVLTQNSITDKENEIAQLEVARDAAAQRAEAMAPYAEFASLQASRQQTIATLADSRFDWERVLRELALVIPGDIALDSLDASTAGKGDAAETTTAGVGSSPSLMLTGCGPTHNSVAAFVAALEDIDGVTRVGLENSVQGGETSSEPSASAPASPSSGCGAKAATFAVTAVFDGVAISATPEAGAPAAPPAAPATSTPAETNSTGEQVEESRQAANVVPGVAP